MEWKVRQNTRYCGFIPIIPTGFFARLFTEGGRRETLVEGDRRHMTTDHENKNKRDS